MFLKRHLFWVLLFSITAVSGQQQLSNTSYFTQNQNINAAIKITTYYSHFLKVITLQTVPNWLNAWWAYSCCVLLLALFGYVILKWRLQCLKNKNMQMVLDSRTKFFMTVAHDLRSPIANFVGLSDTLQFLIKEQDFDMIAKISNEMDVKSKNLNLLVTNILNWSLLEQNFVKPAFESINIYKLIAAITPVYRDIATLKQIEIKKTFSRDAEIHTDKDILPIIIRNLLDNALKNAKESSTININLSKTDTNTTIAISNEVVKTDNIQIEIINKLLSSKYVCEPNTEGMGLGMSIICCNAKLIQATVKASIIENLVTFYITIPNK